MIRSFPKCILPFLLLPVMAAAQNEKENENQSQPAPAKLDLKKFPGSLVDKIVVPVPAEIFAVLDKLDEPNWSSQIQLPESARLPADRIQLALQFGGTVAEGFIAVQAEESEKVEDVGRRVLSLAGSLGLHNAVVPHCQSIIDAAGEKDWKTVREELDKTQQTVRTEMEKLRDDDLANLVSMGGWVRGTGTLTSLISEAYSTDKAELLNQPGLIRHFREQVGKMDKTVRDHDDVVEVRSGLDAILNALTEQADDNGNLSEIPASTVNRIGESCDILLKRFYFEKKSEAAE